MPALAEPCHLNAQHTGVVAVHLPCVIGKEVEITALTRRDHRFLTKAVVFVIRDLVLAGLSHLPVGDCSDKR